MNYAITKDYMKYLNKTSYNSSIRYAIAKIIKFSYASDILIFGNGIGSIIGKLAIDYDHINFNVIDLIDDTAYLNKNFLRKSYLKNVTTYNSGFLNHLHNLVVLPKLTLMLYSFHHIKDPLYNKIKFLTNLKEKMRPGSLLCIAESFLPDNISSADSQFLAKEILKFRSIEAFSNAYWNSLEGLDKQSIQKSEDISIFSYNFEKKTGDLVLERENEYLVHTRWLCDVATDLGFTVVLNMPVNSLGDAVVLLTC